MIVVTLDYYGALRELKAKGITAELCFETPIKVSEIKSALQSEVSSKLTGDAYQNLIHDSAIADDERVLTMGAIIDQSCRLSLLPPVCGG